MEENGKNNHVFIKPLKVHIKSLLQVKIRKMRGWCIIKVTNNLIKNIIWIQATHITKEINNKNKHKITFHYKCQELITTKKLKLKRKIELKVFPRNTPKRNIGNHWVKLIFIIHILIIMEDIKVKLNLSIINLICKKEKVL